MADMENGSEVIGLFDGGHSYISPRWHQEQKVPTWNYARLQLTCSVELITDEEEKLKQVIDMSRYYDPKWSVEEISAPHFAKQLRQMLNAITAFRLDIQSSDGRFKLGQRKSSDYHRTMADHMLLDGCEQLAGWQRQPPVEN